MTMRDKEKGIVNSVGGKIGNLLDDRLSLRGRAGRAAEHANWDETKVRRATAKLEQEEKNHEADLWEAGESGRRAEKRQEKHEGEGKNFLTAVFTDEAYSNPGDTAGVITEVSNSLGNQLEQAVLPVLTPVPVFGRNPDTQALLTAYNRIHSKPASALELLTKYRSPQRGTHHVMEAPLAAMIATSGTKYDFFRRLTAPSAELAEEAQKWLAEEIQKEQLAKPTKLPKQVESKTVGSAILVNQLSKLGDEIILSCQGLIDNPASGPKTKKIQLYSQIVTWLEDFRVLYATQGTMDNPGFDLEQLSSMAQIISGAGLRAFRQDHPLSSQDEETVVQQADQLIDKAGTQSNDIKLSQNVRASRLASADGIAKRLSGQLLDVVKHFIGEVKAQESILMTGLTLDDSSAPLSLENIWRNVSDPLANQVISLAPSPEQCLNQADWLPQQAKETLIKTYKELGVITIKQAGFEDWLTSGKENDPALKGLELQTQNTIRQIIAADKKGNEAHLAVANWLYAQMDNHVSGSLEYNFYQQQLHSLLERFRIDVGSLDTYGKVTKRLSTERLKGSFRPTSYHAKNTPLFDRESFSCLQVPSDFVITPRLGQLIAAEEAFSESALASVAKHIPDLPNLDDAPDSLLMQKLGDKKAIVDEAIDGMIPSNTRFFEEDTTFAQLMDKPRDYVVLKPLAPRVFGAMMAINAVENDQLPRWITDAVVAHPTLRDQMASIMAQALDRINTGVDEDASLATFMVAFVASEVLDESIANPTVPSSHLPEYKGSLQYLKYAFADLLTEVEDLREDKSNQKKIDSQTARRKRGELASRAVEIILEYGTPAHAVDLFGALFQDSFNKHRYHMFYGKNRKFLAATEILSKSLEKLDPNDPESRRLSAAVANQTAQAVAAANRDLLSADKLQELSSDSDMAKEWYQQLQATIDLLCATISTDTTWGNLVPKNQKITLVSDDSIADDTRASTVFRRRTGLLKSTAIESPPVKILSNETTQLLGLSDHEGWTQQEVLAIVAKNVIDTFLLDRKDSLVKAGLTGKQVSGLIRTADLAVQSGDRQVRSQGALWSEAANEAIQSLSQATGEAHKALKLLTGIIKTYVIGANLHGLEFDYQIDDDFKVGITTSARTHSSQADLLTRTAKQLNLEEAELIELLASHPEMTEMIFPIVQNLRRQQ